MSLSTARNTFAVALVFRISLSLGRRVGKSSENRLKETPHRRRALANEEFEMSACVYVLSTEHVRGTCVRLLLAGKY